MLSFLSKFPVQKARRENMLGYNLLKNKPKMVNAPEGLNQVF